MVNNGFPRILRRSHYSGRICVIHCRELDLSGWTFSSEVPESGPLYDWFSGQLTEILHVLFELPKAGRADDETYLALEIPSLFINSSCVSPDHPLDLDITLELQEFDTCVVHRYNLRDMLSKNIMDLDSSTDAPKLRRFQEALRELADSMDDSIKSLETD